MDESIHRYFISGDNLSSSCDFIPERFLAEGTVYEVIRILRGKPLFLNEHLHRLKQSAALANFQDNIDIQKIKRVLHVLIQANEVEEGNIKLVAFSRPMMEISCWFMPHFYPNEIMYRDGVHLSLFEFEREKPQLKSQRNKYKELVNNKLKLDNAYELMLVHDGKISEGSKSNVFFVKDNCLITAPDTDVLAGITRQKCIELALSQLIHLEYKKFQIDELNEASSCFITGTSPKILPVRSINAFDHFELDHPIVLSLMEMYQKEIETDIENFSW